MMHALDTVLGTTVQVSEFTTSEIPGITKTKYNTYTGITEYYVSATGERELRIFPGWWCVLDMENLGLVLSVLSGKEFHEKYSLIWVDRQGPQQAVRVKLTCVDCRRPFRVWTSKPESEMFDKFDLCCSGKTIISIKHP